MKLKFKIQAYQTHAVEAEMDCFKGQLNTSGINYRIKKQSGLYKALALPA
ncbi:MAG: hypothetical protein KKH34_08980 [Candidatus Omnitrophica bacterium]|nr:hypothetical protein [Candidatus Omnitrophota bacterium]MCG2710812.1 hypothetical protein [Candidatus Omnitrophota bacterium]